MDNYHSSLRLRLALAAGLLAIASYAKAAPCISGTLDTYAALGPLGCTIGAAQFSDFTILPGSFTQIDPSGITLTPTVDPGFLVDLGVLAGAGETLQSNFTFAASGALFNSADIALIGSFVTPDGANTAAAIFTPGAIAIAFDIGLDASLVESAALGGIPSVLTELDFVVDGGSAGEASLNQGSIAFSTTAPVPEPATALFVLPALFLLICRTRKQPAQS